MLTQELKCGLFYKVVRCNNMVDYDQHFLNHLDLAYNNGDRLSNNYNLHAIDRMQEYGYVYDNTPDNLVYMVGLEKMLPGVYRSESRLFVHPEWRRRVWTSPDSYETVKLQIAKHEHESEMIFKSRDGKNPGGFKVSQRLDPYFNSWTIYPKQIELKYKNNWQWIMYKGEPNDIERQIAALTYQI